MKTRMRFLQPCLLSKLNFTSQLPTPLLPLLLARTWGMRNERLQSVHRSSSLLFLPIHTFPPLQPRVPLTGCSPSWKLLQSGAVPHELQLLPENLLLPRLLSTGSRLCWFLHGLQLPSGHIPLLQDGVLYRLPCGYGLQGGPVNRLQRHLCSDACSISSPFSLTLVFYRFFSQTFFIIPHRCAAICTYFNVFPQGHHHLGWGVRLCPEVDLLELSGTSCVRYRSLSSQRPPLQPPCYQYLAQ